MLLITDLKDLPTLTDCGLTIGTFDGVHLGHQALLRHLKKKSGKVVVFTFSNHPTQVFRPDNPTPLICPPLQKVKQLYDSGADIVILVPFTPSFAQTPFDKFLHDLKLKINFSHLTLGTGAVLGKNREGNEDNIRTLGTKLHFSVDYLPKTLLKGQPISSGRIRTAITQGHFHEVQESLGRPYSLMGHLNENDFPLPGICMPPDGVYAVQIKTGATQHLGRALISSKKQSLQLDLPTSLHGKDVEVIFPGANFSKHSSLE